MIGASGVKLRLVGGPKLPKTMASGSRGRRRPLEGGILWAKADPPSASSSQGGGWIEDVGGWRVVEVASPVIVEVSEPDPPERAEKEA